MSVVIASDSICQCKVNAKRICKQTRNSLFNNMFCDVLWQHSQSVLFFQCVHFQLFLSDDYLASMPDNFIYILFIAKAANLTGNL